MAASLHEINMLEGNQPEFHACDQIGDDFENCVKIIPGNSCFSRSVKRHRKPREKYNLILLCYT